MYFDLKPLDGDLEGSMSEELKAGHPPAVKAGGMRVVTKHKAAEKVDADAYDQKYVDQLPEQPTISAINTVQPSGSKQHHDQPSEAVRAAHQKPLPKVEKSHSPSKLKHINQPRKQ